jgi:hypothetical protein
VGKKGNSYEVLFGRHEGKRSLGRPTRRWENNIDIEYSVTVYFEYGNKPQVSIN